MTRRALEPHDPPASIACPRCGYDLRGVTAAWHDACPVAGTCAECGLDFPWREILDPRYNQPSWLIENDHRGRLRVGQVIGTMVRTLHPWRFWSRISMACPLHHGRLALHLAAVALAIYLVFAGCVAQGSLLAARLMGLSGPGASPGVAGTPSAAEVLAHAFLRPLSQTSPGNLVIFQSGGPITVGLLPPFEIARRLTYAAAPLILLFMGALGGIAVAFAALPISRRRAQVRRRHVVRALIYGTTLLVPAASLVLAGHVTFVSAPWLGTPRGTIARLLVAAGPALLFGGSLVWWLAAVRRYLRMEHHWAIALSVWTIGWLAAATAGAIIVVAVP